MLRTLADNLWVTEQPLRFYGIEVGCRMAVVRLADGSLWLHSPVRIDAALRAALDRLGAVRYAVAPNRLHHLYAAGVTQTYPDARLWVAPGLDRKRPDLAIAGVLTDDPPDAWRSQIDQHCFQGRPFDNEVAFLHRASRTLLLCDLAFNFGPTTPRLTRVLVTLIGGYGGFRTTRMDPLFLRDRAAARRSLEHFLAWDFDRIVVAHGDVLERGGREQLRAAYRWLLA